MATEPVATWLAPSHPFESDKRAPLVDEQATTRGPPDVNAQTRIIGLLGTSDIDDGASPQNDGWMVADFYAWKGAVRGMGRSQTWMTSLDPTALVDKYEVDFGGANGPYVHGDPFEDARAVVLNRAQLPQALEDLKVYRDDGTTRLRNAFLQEFRSQCLAAAAEGGNVLLIVCSHGDPAEGGLVISVEGALKNNIMTFKPDDLLNQDMLANTCRDIKPLKIATFLASCFSGNWVYSPVWRYNSDVISVAARDHEESWSWVGATWGRLCGGVFSTYVLQEILKEAKVISSDEEMAAIRAPSNDEERTFKQYCDAVTARMTRLQCRDEIFGSLPVFTEDNGHENFWVRSGYPLGDYAANWASFPKIPRTTAITSDLDKKNPLSDSSPKQNFSSADLFAGTAGTGSWSGATGKRLRSKTQDLARRYLGSNPGISNSNANRLVYGRCLNLFNGRLPDSQLVALEIALTYRLYKMKAADQLARHMGQHQKLEHTLPEISHWSFENWHANNLEGAQKTTQRIQFYQTLNKVKNWKLCTLRPDINVGPEWIKPECYLTAMVVMNGIDPDAWWTRYLNLTQTRAKELARRSLKNSRRLRGICDAALAYKMSLRSSSPSKRKGVKDLFGGDSGSGAGPSGIYRHE